MSGGCRLGTVKQIKTRPRRGRILMFVLGRLQVATVCGRWEVDRLDVDFGSF